MGSAHVLLINPKYPHNVGGVVRAASCFDAETVRWTGTRVSATPTDSYRLPREERMRDYREVDFKPDDRAFDFYHARNITPVCIEVGPINQQLHHFDHPENAAYVFGPEDGSVPTFARRFCHYFVTIPTRHCTNLAAAVYITLYDRFAKQRLDNPSLDVPTYKLMRGRNKGYAEHYQMEA